MIRWLDNLKYQPVALVAFVLMVAISLTMEPRKR